MSANFICRVCGNVSIQEGKPQLFEEISFIYYNITNLQIVDESTHPKYVCQYCYGKLMGIEWFSKMCINSYDRITASKSAMYNRSYEALNKEGNNHEAFQDQSYNELRNPFSSKSIQNSERIIPSQSQESKMYYLHRHRQASAYNEASNVSNSPFSISVLNSVQEQQLLPASLSNNDRSEKATSKPNSDLLMIHQRLDQLGSKMDVHCAILQRLELFMLNSAYSKPLVPVRDEMRQRCNESFEEFEKMTKIETTQQLTELDTKLANPVFESKFFRYLQSVYNLTGKREGFPFFKMVIRSLLIPTVLLPYSWKGNSRAKKGDSNTSVIVNDKNFSFKNMFPNFVRFMYRVVSAADIEFTSEDTEKAFSDHLRQKNIEVKRYIESNGMQREACIRKRRRREPAENDRGLENVFCINDTTDGDFSYDEDTFSDAGADVVDIKQERLEVLS